MIGRSAGELLPIPRTLSVMLTHKCNAQCAHCGTLSGPEVNDRTDLASILATIEAAPSNGFANVVFTGGEPTIYFEDLLVCIARSKATGLSTRIVTNGIWAKHLERGAGKLDKLIQAGLDEINFSTGDEHVRFVPLDVVVNGLVLALDRKLPVHLMIELRRERTITSSSVLNHPRILNHPAKNTLGIGESPWMPLDPFVQQHYEDGMTANSENVCGYSGCDSVLQTYVLHPGNEMTTCCGIGSRVIPELKAERLLDPSASAASLREIIAEAEEDFLKLWLRQEGPEKILHWAASKDKAIKWENLYAHRCQACARIYRDPEVARVLREYYYEKIPDVIARSVLFELHEPVTKESWTLQA